ncbi:MAG: IS630 family transposase [Actinomycetota bacterium]|nr:IS630 family transposase [Actinomycetota bacterium]
MPSPTAVPIRLAAEERELLEAWTRRRRTAAALSMRSRIVLACAGGESNTEIAARLGVHRNTVALWRRRFWEFRVDGLLDEPQPGQPRKITDAQVDAVITKTLESAPKNATHWSSRSMAKEAGVSQTAVSRIWRAFGLKPHQQDTWKLSKDPLFVEKVRDVVGLNLDPPERAVVLFVGESPRSRPWTGPRRSCRCAPGSPSARPATTSDTARAVSTQR